MRVLRRRNRRRRDKLTTSNHVLIQWQFLKKRSASLLSKQRTRGLSPGQPLAPARAPALRAGPHGPLHGCPGPGSRGSRGPTSRLTLGIQACLLNRESVRHISPGSSPFLNQIHLISHLYFGRGKNVISNLKFKKSSSSSKCTQLRWCLANYLCHSHTPARGPTAGTGSAPQTLPVPLYLPRDVVLGLPERWGHVW